MLNDENEHPGRGHCIGCRVELGILILKFIGLSWGVAMVVSLIILCFVGVVN
jgi:hypothetical protein